MTRRPSPGDRGPPGRGESGPDRAAALAQYRRRAGVYDLELALFEPIRRAAIAQLAPRPGETVLDVGCGTGLSLPALVGAVGAQGTVIGIEQSPEMIARAGERVAQHGWRQVTLLCSPVETAPLRGRADAALFHFTHDILCRPEAVAHVLAHLEPGARVVACGLQWARGIGFAANALVLPAALRSVTSLRGLGAPWRELEKHLGTLDRRAMLLGAVYLASGRVPQSMGTPRTAPARQRGGP